VLHRHLALVDRVLDQPAPPELSGHIETSNIGFEKRREIGNPHVMHGASRGMKDAAHRARGHTFPMTHAARAVHHGQLVD
jgi:hypothetical protein